MTLSMGQRLTLVKIDDCLAMTHRYELEVRSVLEPQSVGYEGRRQRVAVVRQRGKRKEFYLDLAGDDILLDGWGLPFSTDTEGSGVMAGNACYNLVGESEVIRQCIECRAVVPVSDSAKAKIIVGRAERTTCNDDGLALLYPEIETHHAVVNRIKGSATHSGLCQ
ncbi:MAG: hypothetical protein ACJ8FY_18500 [Gemmataceae bacterium]